MRYLPRWLILRALRWLFWIAFFAVSIYVMMYRESVVTGFGHLTLFFDLLLFGYALGAVFAGLLELMMREKAGLQRPSFGHLIPLGNRSKRSRVLLVERV